MVLDDKILFFINKYNIYFNHYLVYTQSKLFQFLFLNQFFYKIQLMISSNQDNSILVLNNHHLKSSLKVLKRILYHNLYHDTLIL